jgi:hypothetical protein
VLGGALLAALWIAGCARVGSDARGQAQAIDRADLAREDMIPYRKLALSDFRAAEIPAQVRASRHTVGGYTCLTLVHEGPISVAPLAGDVRRFRAELLRVRFRAYMNRRCSWLNPEAPLAPEYILEHEQIHFAIWEIEARRLNRAPQSIRSEVQSIARSEQAAVEATKQKIARILERALDDLRAQNQKFDDETSFGYYPERQKKWLTQVRAGLQRYTANH